VKFGVSSLREEHTSMMETRVLDEVLRKVFGPTEEEVK
jgi:hypothetical protein